ncbi:probable LRR receptor-like serine/threonine-protein kinase At1g53430 [Coffea eugenioides]|uniref:probable LRR receptor-like serine/threonine-protein kinase At1g53430 n=1 Tax=Coffea eugenioides TaxID=49369 RepID=UPI000F606425|nr:probable LRR receptor-like serine/threonine-protein kinase At1g53430 [Coffea eugenioides]
MTGAPAAAPSPQPPFLPPPPKPTKPKLPKEEVDAVKSLLRLMSPYSPLGPAYFSALSCHYIKFSLVLTCNCMLEDKTCRVVLIDLSGQDLTGSIPPEIGNLSHLESLYLRSNSLNGSIPNSFVKLSQLSELNLCDNKLGGPLPKFLPELKSLRSLYLCNNLFNESIPPEIGGCPKLEYLSLYNNSLWGKLPDELGHVSTLRGLNLAENQFGGRLPESLGRLAHLEEMYVMNNLFDDQLPQSFQSLKKLKSFNIRGNAFNKSIPGYIFEWHKLQSLSLMGNNFEGHLPEILGLPRLTYLAINNLPGGKPGVLFPDIRNMVSLTSLTLRNCSLTGSIPDYIWGFKYLLYLDLSFNNLMGIIPPDLNQFQPKFIFLRSNNLNGAVPGWLTSLSDSGSYVDVSENSFTNVNLTNGNISSNLNLFECCSQYSDTRPKWQQAGYHCDNDTPSYDHLYINCGGNATSVDDRDYEADTQSYGGSTFFLSTNKTWAYSSMGTFLETDDDEFILNKTCNISNSDASLYSNARIAPISLKYYGFCLKNDTYTVKLHFAEIGWDTNTSSTIRKRVFDVEVQGGQYYLRDFDIQKEAGDVNKVRTKEFNVSVNDSRLEIHLYWTGKGSTYNPTKYYGPSISAISVYPVRREPEPVPRNDKISSSAIAGIVGSALVFGILILALSWALVRIRLRKLRDPGFKDFDFNKLNAATNGFDSANKIDVAGNVYRGELDGIQVAVKQLSAKSEEGAHEFITAMGTISALKHPNLATLVGSCAEKNLLVYKYMENVSLQHALFGPAEVKSELNWETRYKICLGVAEGLACLHESKQVIHCNIKPTNILLDKDFTVKISDFEYSQFHDSKHVDAQPNKDETGLGSMPKPKMTGHMAPEQEKGNRLTPKADVFSFGMITLEIVSGQEICPLGSKDSNDYLPVKALNNQVEGKAYSFS